MLITSTDIYLPPTCKYATEDPGFKLSKEVHVLGLRYKNFPRKLSKHKKKFLVELGGREYDGKNFKQIVNEDSFIIANFNGISFKNPRGTIDIVSKFFYISIRKHKNNKKCAVFEFKSKFFCFLSIP